MGIYIPWTSQASLERTRQFDCGYCGFHVSASLGFVRQDNDMTIGICPQCSKPTFFEGHGEKARQIPGTVYGEKVDHLPPDIELLYNEARNCHTVAAYTAGAMACRKVLMCAAFNKGASANLNFKQYVDYLESNGFVVKSGKAWIDHIRLKGNEATHEIPPTAKGDLEDLLTFLAMFLRITYEFPKRLPAGS